MALGPHVPEWLQLKSRLNRLAVEARALNVALVLEGSVRRYGDQVRITAQLIEARSDTHEWSHTYDRTLDDIFAVQDEIAAAVVAQLKITLLGAAPKARLWSASTVEGIRRRAGDYLINALPAM